MATAQFSQPAPGQFFTRMPELGAATDVVRVWESTFGDTLYAWGPAPLAPVDFAERLSTVAVQHYDPATRYLPYTVTSGPTPDFVIGRFVTMNGSWSIIAPFDDAGIAFPRMPSDALDVAPIDGYILFGTNPGGYRVIRQNYPLELGFSNRELDEMIRAGIFTDSGMVAVRFVGIDPP